MILRYLKIAGAIALLASPVFAVLFAIALGKGCAEAPSSGPTAAIIKIHHHVGATAAAAAEINEAADKAAAEIIDEAPAKASGYDVEELKKLLKLYSEDPI